MTTILEKRFIKLLSNYNIEKLHEYFNITNARILMLDLNTIEVKYDKVNQQNITTIAILKKSKIHKLPDEMVDEIVKYIPTHEYLYLTLNVDYPTEYPFIPPIWSLNKCFTNVQNKKIDIKGYFQNILGLHNKSYWKDWSPATHIDSDIISVFLKIDKFNKLF
jgi:hypothetical protein